MKTLCLSVLVLLTAVPVFSQNKVGLFAGPQATSAKYVIAGQKQETEYKYGFQAGVSMKVPFEGQLYFAPAAFYSLKGYKVMFTRFAFPPDTAAIDNDTRLHTFELAAMLQYDFGKGPGHVFIKAGPSLDFQLFGREKFNKKTGGQVERNMVFSFGDYGHFAASMNLHLGYETAGGFVVTAQYAHGLGSINNADLGPRIRHRVFALSIGRYLKKK